MDIYNVINNRYFNFSLMTSEIEKIISLGILVSFSMVVFGVLIYYFRAFSLADFKYAKN